MFTPIHEQVVVAGVYQTGKFLPRRFQWRTRTYPVDQITATADVRNGATRQRRYSLSSGGNVYRLLFDRDQESWLLEEVYVE